VTDLQCAATLLVIRHGEATYAEPDVPSDEGGVLTERGRRQATELSEAVRRYAVAAVYTSVMQRAVDTAAILAERLDVGCEPLPGLQEFTVGTFGRRLGAHGLIAAVFARWLDGDLDASWPGGETATAVIGRFRAVLQSVADLHRGETVVVVSHGGVMSLAIPRLCDNAATELSRAHWLPNCAMAEIVVDADGWLLRNWPGSRDQAYVEPDSPAG
jgi:probable phosphoglycerate mutase